MSDKPPTSFAEERLQALQKFATAVLEHGGKDDMTEFLMAFDLVEVRLSAALDRAIRAGTPETKDWFNRAELRWKEEKRENFTSRDSAMYDHGFNAGVDATLHSIRKGLGLEDNKKDAEAP